MHFSYLMTDQTSDRYTREMAQSNRYHIDVAKLESIKAVTDQIQLLDKNLGGMDMMQFSVFNNAYLIVTSIIQDAIKDDYFINPKLIEEFIVVFAGYYFKAINETFDNSETLRVSWSMMNTIKGRPYPAIISLLLGANAHINNDLPYVLSKVMNNSVAENLLGDLVRIDKLLMRSGKQIIGSFTEQNTRLDFLKRRFQFLYYRPAMYTILYWRIIAWRNYQKLLDTDATLAQIDIRSQKIGNRLLRAARILLLVAPY
ncbi:DUF5995 family protein [Acidithrix sp. C25]|uniref:DUF5995 family protein n=1 Tax=Acidithrix sp. C25 TaxID=1671482 RepID=UPI00191BA7DC|nr:DUF5995 family protein [Acidithrix sp. C25]CAG4902059.1 unnamed protein product [Acidithrix sp. C25]